MSSNKMYETLAIAKPSKEGDFETITIKRGETGPDDIEFDIKYCGICHSDVHIAQDELQPFYVTKYPCVPGHELAGVVSKVGKNVQNIKVGDKVGVGCIVDACLGCPSCKKGNEQYCHSRSTMTYNAECAKHGRISTDSGYTYGGYSGKISVNKAFIIQVPKDYPLECAGPIFCAGITTYSPLSHWGALNGGKRVGVIGIGGLGQMGVRQAAAMGNIVTAISTSPNKEKVAKEIGATHFIVSKDEEQMKKAHGSLDLIINTVSVSHQASTYMPLLAQDGTMVMLGVAPEPHKIVQGSLIWNRKSLGGSIIGGIKETQDCIDFCHKNNIKPAIDIITKEKLGEVYKKLSGKNDSVIRYVLDVDKSLKMT